MLLIHCFELESMLKYLRKLFAIFSPRTAPSLVTVACKAGMGGTLMFVGNFLKSFIPNQPSELETTLLKRENLNGLDFEFLQSNSYADFIVKNGQVILIDAAADLSKILLGLAAKRLQKLKLEYNRRKAQNLLLQIDKELKQKQNGKNKNSRKNKAIIEELKKEHDQIIRREVFDGNYDTDVDPKVYVYMSFVVEILASLYLIISFLEILNFFSDEKDTFRIDQNTANIGNLFLYFTHTSPIMYYLNYLWCSPKVVMVIASSQLILNKTDFGKMQTSKMLGNIPILALINSLGFKFISLSAICNVSRQAFAAKEWMNLITPFFKKTELIETHSYTRDAFRKYFGIALMKLGGDKAKASEVARYETLKMIQNVYNANQKLAERKDIFLFLTRGINLYGNFKFYKNLLHILDNILDLLEQRMLAPVSELYPIREVEALEFSVRLSDSESLIKKPCRDDNDSLSIQSTPNPTVQSTHQYSSQFALIKASAYQNSIVFPEEPVRKNPKVKTKGNATSLNTGMDSAASNREYLKTEIKFSPEENEKKKRRDEILSCYSFCNRQLLRTILKPQKNVHLNIDKKNILKLARDLKLDHHKTESGYMIQVYKRFGATFHSIHGKDGAGTVKSFFISDLAKAFSEIGVTIEALDEIDDKLDKQSCMQSNAISMLTYVLTERPKAVNRKFR